MLVLVEQSRLVFYLDDVARELTHIPSSDPLRKERIDLPQCVIGRHQNIGSTIGTHERSSSDIL
jgi:hypothetical protein